MPRINSKGLFSSDSDEWATPKKFYEDLDREFGFNLDPCASNENHKCDKYFTKEENGLEQDWGGSTAYVNPPYSDIGNWVAKSYYDGCKDDTTVVLLLPSRTDTRYFHNYCLNRAEIRFIKGRLKFNDGKGTAPFPSMLVIFRGAVTK